MLRPTRSPESMTNSPMSTANGSGTSRPRGASSRGAVSFTLNPRRRGKPRSFGNRGAYQGLRRTLRQSNPNFHPRVPRYLDFWRKLKTPVLHLGVAAVLETQRGVAGKWDEAMLRNPLDLSGISTPILSGLGFRATINRQSIRWGSLSPTKMSLARRLYC